MDEAKKRELLSKVPKHLRATKRTNVFDYLEDKIESIILQAETIKELNDEIIIGFTNQLPVCDKVFKARFDRWDKNPADMELLQKVKENIKSFGADYEKYNTEFRKEMKTVDDASKTLYKSMESASSLFDDILRSETKTITVEQANDMMKQARRIVRQQEELITQLRIVQVIQYNFNTERMKWANIIIGLTESSASVEKTAKKQQHLILFNGSNRSRHPM